MRILSYNIKDGGGGREEQLLQVIRGQAPDVVGLVEAGDRDVAVKLARELGMDFVHAEGNKGGAALLARYPIVHSVNHALLQGDRISKSFAEVLVDVPGRGGVTFGVVHLHAHARDGDESRRQKEIDRILMLMADHRVKHRPHVLLGDFNSNSPVQQIEIDRCKKATREEYEANGKTIPRRVVQTILDAGYTDVMQVLRTDLARTGGTFSTEHPGQRVDYVFTHGIPLRDLSRAEIVTAAPAKDASDHYPVLVEIA